MDAVGAHEGGKPAPTTREQFWNVLQHGHGRAGRWFTCLLIVAILVSISILPLEFLPALSAYRDTLLLIEVILTALFTVEYAARLYAAPRRLRYAFSFFGIVDFFSIAPFYVGLLGTQYLRVLRLARLLRLLKIARIEAADAAMDRCATGFEVKLLPGECVDLVVTKHPILILIGLVPPLLATTVSLSVLLAFSFHPVALAVAVTLLLFAALFLYKAWLDYRFDVIYITSHRLIFQNRHLLGTTKNEVDYRAITNIKPTYVGIVSYLLGYGSLIIETPASDVGRIEHTMVRRHEEAAHMISKRSFSPGSR
jgi:hypothetical protein